MNTKHLLQFRPRYATEAIVLRQNLACKLSEEIRCRLSVATGEQSACNLHSRVFALTCLGTKGATLMSTIRKASRPNTRKRESTHASSAFRPIFAVPDMCHELAVLVRICSYGNLISIVEPSTYRPSTRTQIASSESSAGMYVFNVFSAYAGADRRRFVTFIPSIRTRRSKAWLRKLGSIRGAAEGSFECSRTEPLLWGFRSRQMAPRNSV